MMADNNAPTARNGIASINMEATTAENVEKLSSMWFLYPQGFRCHFTEARHKIETAQHDQAIGMLSS
jgi:hypothetical protein